MREIDCGLVRGSVRDLLIQANYRIGSDVLESLARGESAEESPVGRNVLHLIAENDRVAAREDLPICQDTGMAVVFLGIGQDLRLTGGPLEEAVNAGVRDAYRDAWLRNSVVGEPLFDRKNTGDNSPAVLHVEIVPGDGLRIDVMAKGFGSENMSALKMLTPADGAEGVLDFIVETVRAAGPNPCPPIFVGVGLGGTMEKAALLSKKALLRHTGSAHPDGRYAKLEADALSRINDLGIGPAGLGGRVTALGVYVEHYPTHIASIPVAVNICCHASRHAGVTL